MDNPLKNKAQCETAEKYIDYLNARMKNHSTSVTECYQIKEEMDSIQGDINDFKNNGIRLVVDNT